MMPKKKVDRKSIKQSVPSKSFAEMQSEFEAIHEEYREASLAAAAIPDDKPERYQAYVRVERLRELMEAHPCCPPSGRRGAKPQHPIDMILEQIEAYNILGELSDRGREVIERKLITLRRQYDAAEEFRETWRGIAPHQSLSGRVRLYGQGECPVVDGETVGRLSTPEYVVVQTLIAAGKVSLSLEELRDKSGYPHAEKIFRNLRKRKETDDSQPWHDVLRSKQGQGYWIL